MGVNLQLYHRLKRHIEFKPLRTAVFFHIIPYFLEKKNALVVVSIYLIDKMHAFLTLFSSGLSLRYSLFKKEKMTHVIIPAYTSSLLT